MRKSAIIFLGLFLCTLIVNAQDLEDGITQFYQGNLEQSKQIFEQIAQNQRGRSNLEEGLALKFLGNIYSLLFDYKTAERYYLEALQIFNTIGNNTERANTLNNLGTVYKELKDYSRAIESYDTAIQILTGEKDFVGAGHVMLNKAVLYEGKNDYSNAEKEYKNLETWIKENSIEDPELSGNLHLGRGNLYYRKNKFEDALEDFVKANFIYTKAKLKLGIAYSLVNMGITQKQLNNIDAAIKSLNKARIIIEEMRGEISMERSRVTFLENKIFIYEQLISLYLLNNQPDQAFRMVEYAKAKTFIDMIGTKVVGEEKYNDNVKSLIQKEKELSFEISSKIDKQDVTGLITKHKSILQQLRQLAPDYSSIKSVEPISLNKIYNSLGNDMILVEYFLGTEFAFVFVLKGWTIKATVLEEKPWEIEARVQKFRKSSIGSNMNILDKSWQDDLNWLYQTLIDPIKEELDKNKIICIVPHKSLHHLPFNALVSKKDKKSKNLPRPRFMIEDYKMIMMPSASLFKFLGSPVWKKVKKEKKLILANAKYPPDWNELKFAEEEALELKRLYPDADVKIKEEATESYLKSNVTGFDIIHLATHGILHPDTPLESKILLTKDSVNDGELTVKELFNMDIKASLVILSACESGKFSSYTQQTSKQLPYGDDVVGLTRALIYAGTPFIISSLWEINDKSTKTLFINFYQNLEKEDYITAFRNAQLQLMETEPKYAHPNYWAPFQLYY